MESIYFYGGIQFQYTALTSSVQASFNSKGIFRVPLSSKNLGFWKFYDPKIKEILNLPHCQRATTGVMILHIEQATVFSNYRAWLKQCWRQPRLEWLGLVISFSKKAVTSGGTGKEAGRINKVWHLCGSVWWLWKCLLWTLIHPEKNQGCMPGTWKEQYNQDSEERRADYSSCQTTSWLSLKKNFDNKWSKLQWCKVLWRFFKILFILFQNLT